MCGFADFRVDTVLGSRSTAYSGIAFARRTHPPQALIQLPVSVQTFSFAVTRLPPLGYSLRKENARTSVQIPSLIFPWLKAGALRRILVTSFNFNNSYFMTFYQQLTTLTLLELDDRSYLVTRQSPQRLTDLLSLLAGMYPLTLQYDE